LIFSISAFMDAWRCALTSGFGLQMNCNITIFQNTTRSLRTHMHVHYYIIKHVVARLCRLCRCNMAVSSCVVLCRCERADSCNIHAGDVPS
jgi:hypothetical protein